MTLAEPNDLAVRLRRSNRNDLHDLLGDHLDILNLKHVRQLLLNPFCSGEHIEILSRQRRLMAIYTVRSALARHRRTPEVVSLGLIPSLFWRDLLEIHLDVGLRSTLRRSAESYLIKRLPRLAIGEKMTLARRAHPLVLAHLGQDPNLAVIRAMLENPRLTEQALLPIVSHRKTHPRVLDLVASDPRWGRRYEIRVALSRNPLTSFRAVFEILPNLQRRDLEALTDMEELSTLVKHRAAEVLREKVPRNR